MERRTGETTRLIDEAIQTLFKDGEVSLHDHKFENEVGVHIHIRLAQRMGKIILRRLEAEHPHVKYETDSKEGWPIIKLVEI